MLWTYLSLAVSVLAIGVAAYFYKWVQNLPVAEGNISQIGQLIKNGAFTFLKREYRILAVFVGVVSVIILIIFPSPIWEGNAGQNLFAAVAYFNPTRQLPMARS
jgi:K(+)-stimulated pyrophosphate-energized sodium pump